MWKTASTCSTRRHPVAKFDDERVGILLACTGAIKGRHLGCGNARLQADGAARGAGAAGNCWPVWRRDAGGKRFPGYDLLQQAGRRRGFLLRGGEIDTERMAPSCSTSFGAGCWGGSRLSAPNETTVSFSGGRTARRGCVHCREKRVQRTHFSPLFYDNSDVASRHLNYLLYRRCGVGSFHYPFQRGRCDDVGI